MVDAKHPAGLIEPAMIALGLTEALNIHMFEHPIAPVVCVRNHE